MSLKTLQVFQAVMWFCVAGVVATFGMSVWTAMHTRHAPEAVTDVHVIPVPAVAAPK